MEEGEDGIDTETGKATKHRELAPQLADIVAGKVLEHVFENRWQDYLEQEGLYPDSMIRFRRGLSTQDAMIQLKQEIIENETIDIMVILGLELQSAIDRVKHSGILAQVTELNMVERSYE
ncbi:uncharacterized protein LOC144160631 [Haemaphysalis longicornis]